MTGDRAITADLMAQLKRHYINPADPLPGGLFVPECGINGAYGGRADALYVGFTSASGRTLIGHEVKASRSDWRRELERVGKADQWADACHAWWIVAPDGVVPVEELPAAWGLMVPNPRPNTRRMKVLKRAVVDLDRTPPWQIVRSIMARADTLRAERESSWRREETNRIEQQLRDQARAQAKSSGDRRLTADERSRLDVLDRLEKALGVKIASWGDGVEQVGPAEAAAALSLVRAGARVHFPTYLADAARRLAADLDAAARAADEWAALGGRS